MNGSFNKLYYNIIVMMMVIIINDRETTIDIRQVKKEYDDGTHHLMLRTTRVNMIRYIDGGCHSIMMEIISESFCPKNNIVVRLRRRRIRRRRQRRQGM